MKKVNSKRKSVDFTKGVRGKYANIKLVVVGASTKTRAAKTKTGNAESVLKQVSRVLNSAGSTKREMESAIDHARELIESVS